MPRVDAARRPSRAWPAWSPADARGVRTRPRLGQANKRFHEPLSYIAPMAPNVLLVVLDAVRRDAVEPYGKAPTAIRYGAPAVATPAIGELARSGFAAPSAYATASWTLPSHASMFSGLLARRLGLGQAPAGSPQSARPRLEQVAGRL